MFSKKTIGAMGGVAGQRNATTLAPGWARHSGAVQHRPGPPSAAAAARTEGGLSRQVRRVECGWRAAQTPPCGSDAGQASLHPLRNPGALELRDSGQDMHLELPGGGGIHGRYAPGTASAALAARDAAGDTTARDGEPRDPVARVVGRRRRMSDDRRYTTSATVTLTPVSRARVAATPTRSASRPSSIVTAGAVPASTFLAKFCNCAV